MPQTFKSFLFYSSIFFFNNANIAIPTTEPITTAAKNPNGFPITGNTNIPPWGALNWQLNNIVSAPAVAEPTTHEGITLNGSAAAKGIAPSVINDNPIM